VSVITVSDPTAPTSGTWLTPTNIEAGLRLADMMAKAKLVPAHLQGSPADCLLVISQAARWRMDPFAVAQATAVVRGKLCYEGKLVASVLVALGAIEGRLVYEFSGEGDGMAVIVTGTPRGANPCSLKGSVKQWRTDNDNWKKDPQSMLVYRGTRQWARLYCPEAILGVYTPDEAEEVVREVQGTVVPEPVAAKVREIPTDASATAESGPSESAPGIEELRAELDRKARHLHDQYGPVFTKVLEKVVADLGVKRLSETPDEKVEGAIARLKIEERCLAEDAGAA
jgi:hypothetical protein